MKKTLQNSEHYFWEEKCEGWHMVQSEGLSVIQEKMPPNTSEKKHYHVKSQQFFYILEGEALFLIDNKEIKLKKGEGFHVKPKIIHHIKNTSNIDLHFLVISQPTTKGDRVDE